VGDRGHLFGQRAQRRGQQRHPRRVTAIDVERHTLTLERPDKRQLTLDTTHYDAIDRGYALTVHKAQGMTADIALVVGSEGATREWAYTAMSRATLATHYYEVFTRPRRDTLASSTGRNKPIRRGADRAGVDPQRVEGVGARLPGALRDARTDHRESSLEALATDRQRALVEMLGGYELSQEATPGGSRRGD